MIWDMLRVVVLVLGGGLGGIAVKVVWNYGRAYVRLRDDPHHRGLLPRHVAAIGLSYLTMIVCSMLDLISVVHEPLTWRAPVYVFAYLTGLWALRDMLGYQKHRKVVLRKS